MNPPPRSAPRTLVAGGTGFVGNALVRRLRDLGGDPRVTTRNPSAARLTSPPGLDVARCDWVTGEGASGVADGIEVAYYFVHSMREGVDFAEADRAAASHFAHEVSRAGVGRVIYLGGLGEDSASLSPHLASRREVEGILRAGRVPVTTLRAAIILGAGGSSFEMLVQLVEKLPIMICPRWVSTPCQPVALDELLRYLIGCATDPRVLGETLDVGGPDVLTYRTMLTTVGDHLGRRPRIFEVPILTPSLSSHWVGFITEVASGVARPLVEGMRNPVVCRDDRLADIFPGPRPSFDAALDRALAGRRPVGPGFQWPRGPRGARPRRAGRNVPSDPAQAPGIDPDGRPPGQDPAGGAAGEAS
jgi:uncharacterized protein YbjT (DUF2867 family)